jgi:hypothetical protein
MEGLSGGCACGAVRFRLLSTPYDAGWCHCRNCQLNSGSPAMAFATIPATDYEIETGAALINRFASSEVGRRAFCSSCGTPLLFQEGDAPETLEVSLATLDTPEAVTPGFHIFYESRIGWAEAADDLPRYARGRRNAEPMV